MTEEAATLDDEREKDELVLEDEEDLVPMGAVADALDAARETAARETAARVATEAGRAPPSALDAERALLGALLIDSSRFDDVVGTGLAASDFYRPAHGTIFRAISKLAAAKEPVDSVTVVDRLLADGRLEAVGGAVAVATLSALVPTAAHAVAYASLVHEKAVLRKCIATATDVIAFCYAQKQRPADIVEHASKTFSSIATHGSTGVANLRAISSTLPSKIPALGGTRPCVATPWHEVNDILGGGPGRGELVIVAARPGLGKTAWADQVAYDLVKNRGRWVFMASMEIGAEQKLIRWAGSVSQVPTRKKEVTSMERDRLLSAIADNAELPLRLVDVSQVSMANLLAEFRAQHALALNETGHGVEMVIVDYLQLMNLGLQGRAAVDSGARAAAVGEISKGLKALARDYNIPVVALSQLNREVEKRANKRPMMSDIRDSGAIEQDADVIIGLYREEYYEKARTADHLRGVAEIIVLKNREGETGTVELGWKGTPPRFISKNDDGKAAPSSFSSHTSNDDNDSDLPF